MRETLCAASGCLRCTVTVGWGYIVRLVAEEGSAVIGSRSEALAPIDVSAVDTQAGF